MLYKAIDASTARQAKRVHLPAQHDAAHLLSGHNCQCDKLGVATEVTAVICTVCTASNYIVM